MKWNLSAMVQCNSTIDRRPFDGPRETFLAQNLCWRFSSPWPTQFSVTLSVVTLKVFFALSLFSLYFAPQPYPTSTIHIDEEWSKTFRQHKHTEPYAILTKTTRRKPRVVFDNRRVTKSVVEDTSLSGQSFIHSFMGSTTWWQWLILALHHNRPHQNKRVLNSQSIVCTLYTAVKV